MLPPIEFNFNYAYGGPAGSAVMRRSADDFRVDELLDIPLSGSGEHHWLHIQKRDTNTEWLARQLAKLANVPARDVSYAGLKDRVAVTSQWFSVRLPGKKEPDWTQIESEQVKLLEAGRHISKLRRGSHKGNCFQIILRDVKAERTVIEQSLNKIREFGVPNYYGEQRFGHEGRNVPNGLSLLQGEIKVKDRHKRSLYLSAVRSYLFNQILSKRVEDGSWQQLMPGEVVILSGTNSHFVAEELDETLLKRLSEGDIGPSAPLWGRGRSIVAGQAQAYERDLLESYQPVLSGLEHAGLEQSRRALRLLVPDLEWEWVSGEDLQLNFGLTKGAFATSLMREVVSY